MLDKQHSQVQTQGNGSSYKAYTFDALISLTQKIHEISEFEHKNYFSTTASHFRIKKGPQLDKNLQPTPPPPPTLQIGNEVSNIKRTIRTAGEVPRPKHSQLHQATKKEEMQLMGDELKIVKLSNGPDRATSNRRHNIADKKRTFSTNSVYNQNSSLESSLAQQNQFLQSQMQQQQSIQSSMKSDSLNPQHHYAKPYMQTLKHNNSEKEHILQSQIQEDNQFYRTSNNWKNKSSQQPSSGIHNPTQFYHLKTVGFKNYKYPRPPQADQMYSPEARNRMPLYLIKDNSKSEANCIESVCVSKIQHDKHMYQSLTKSLRDQNLVHDQQHQQQFDSKQESNHAQSQPDEEKMLTASQQLQQNDFAKSQESQRIYGTAPGDQQENMRSRRSQKYGNKLLFEMDQYNRMMNLHNLELKIEQKNHERQRNIFSRWKARDNQFNVIYGGSSQSQVVSPKENIQDQQQSQSQQGSINNHNHSSNKNINIVSIDRISSPPYLPDQQQERAVSQYQSFS